MSQTVDLQFDLKAGTFGLRHSVFQRDAQNMQVLRSNFLFNFKVVLSELGQQQIRTCVPSSDINDRCVLIKWLKIKVG